MTLKEMEIYLNKFGQEKSAFYIQEHYSHFLHFETLVKARKNKNKLGTILRRKGNKILESEFEYWSP